MAVLLGFVPDAPQQAPGVITDCSAFIPTEKGFKAAPSAISSGVAALAAECRGAAVLQKLDGSRRTFAGTQTKLYELSGTSWADVTDTGGDYTGSTENRWSFAQFGNVSLASNLTEAIQYSNSTGAFDAIATAPKAKIIFTVSGFVMAVHYNDGTLTTDGWFCSGYQDYTVWTPAVSTQCAKGRLFGTPGPFTAGIRFGEDALLFKENTIYLGRYAGPPVVWQWTEVPGQAGCIGQDAVADISTDAQPMVFFVGKDNFYVYNGVRPVPIGVGKVRNWFLSRINQTFGFRTQVFYDRASRNVFIYYPNSTSTTGQPNECLVYNVQNDTWGRDDRTVEAVFNYIASGLTWDGLGAAYSTWNDLPDIPYDSPFWSAGTFVPAFFNTAHTIYTLTGDGANAAFTTGDWGTNDAMSVCTELTPNFTVKPTTASMTNSWRMQLGDGLISDGTSFYNDNKFDCMRAARWHRFAVSTTGSMQLDSVAPKLKPAGLR